MSLRAVTSCSGDMKLAVIDVDGTIFQGAVGLRLLKALMARGLCDAVAARGVFEQIERYARGEIDRDAMVEQTTRGYAAAITGLTRTDVEELAVSVWEEARTGLLPFAGALVADLTRRGFTTLIISSSPEEIIAPLTASLGATDHRGSLFTVSQGEYTGGVE